MAGAEALSDLSVSSRLRQDVMQRSFKKSFQRNCLWCFFIPVIHIADLVQTKSGSNHFIS